MLLDTTLFGRIPVENENWTISSLNTSRIAYRKFLFGF